MPPHARKGPRKIPPPIEPAPPEAGALPEAYGTGELFLRARDPHWLYAYWDLSRESQRQYNALSADGRLALRIYRATISGNPVDELRVHPESQHWFVHVPYAGAKYTAELGYYRRDRVWVSISQSPPAETPREDMSEDRTVQMGSAAAPSGPSVTPEPVGPPGLANLVRSITGPPPPRPGLAPEQAAAFSAPAIPMVPGEQAAKDAEKLSPAMPGGEPQREPQAPVTTTFHPSAPQAVSEPPPASGAVPLRKVDVEATPARTAEQKSAPSLANLAAPRSEPKDSGWRTAPPTFSELPRDSQVRTPAHHLPPAFDQVQSASPPPGQRTESFSFPRTPLTREQEEFLFELIYGLVPSSAASAPADSSAELAPKPEQRVRRAISSPAPMPPEAVPGPAPAPGPDVSSPGKPEQAIGPAPGQPGFWFQVNAELVIYGATEPSAAVTISGRPIQLRPDGTFSYRFSLPDGAYGLDISATSVHQDNRQAWLRFSRQTRLHGDVGKHPQDPALKEPSAGNL